jgi:hypothetical protein
MNSNQFISPRVRTAVNETFVLEQSADAFALLATAPLNEETSAETAEAILLGLVSMSKGDLRRLRTSVEYFDPRDALYAFHGVDWDEELKNSRL